MGLDFGRFLDNRLINVRATTRGRFFGVRRRVAAFQLLLNQNQSGDKSPHSKLASPTLLLHERAGILLWSFRIPSNEHERIGALFPGWIVNTYVDGHVKREHFLQSLLAQIHR